MAQDPIEPLDLDDEVAAMAEKRLARLRHANRIRAIFKADRSIGVDIRNRRKAERQQREREHGR